MIVEHHVSQSQFAISEAGEQALLQYRLRGNAVDFYRTFVPTAWRGQGVGRKLVAAGLHWAREQDFEIEASCWYVDKALKADA